jgi:hypothetical protein
MTLTTLVQKFCLVWMKHKRLLRIFRVAIWVLLVCVGICRLRDWGSSQFSIHQDPSGRFTAVDLAHALFALVQECFTMAIHTKLKGGDAKSLGTGMILELVA